MTPILAKPKGGVRNQRYRQTLEFTPDGLGETPEAHNAKRARLEIATCRWVGTKLEFWYPGHAWHVEAQAGRDGRDGVIKIRINALMPANYWYVIKFKDAMQNEIGAHTIKRGAGELLERYGLRRGNFDLDQWRQALNDMPLLGKFGRGHKAPLLA